MARLMRARGAMDDDRMPVSAGSASAVELEAGLFRITAAYFPARVAVPPHTHDRPCIALMLGGSFDLRFDRGPEYDCRPGSVSVEPAEERHCNCIGCRGARVVVVQPDPGSASLSPFIGRALTERIQFHSPAMMTLARRMDAECRHPDPVSGSMLEGLAFELLALVTRERIPFRRARPAWVGLAEDLIRARWAEPLSVAAIAGQVGVHPTHLARGFRRYHHTSIGRYIRRVRLDWAAEQLATTGRSIAAIAIESGYGDQSHFTRRFREHTGTTPHRWRRAHARTPPSAEVHR